MPGRLTSWFRDLAKYKYNRRFFRKSLTMILLIASIPGIIIGASIYLVAYGNLEGELQRLHQNQIKERAANIDDQLAYLELTFSHWAFEPKFDDNLKDLNISMQFEQVQELYRMLLIMESSHPLLGKVELFLDKPRPLIFDKTKFAYLNAASDIEPYRALLRSEKRPVFWTDTTLGRQGAGSSSLMLVNKVPGGSSEPFGVLIASINKSSLIETFKTLNPYNDGETIVSAGDGSWILSSNGDALTAIDTALLRGVSQKQTRAGSFLFSFNKKKYSVSYGQFSRLGKTWTYISAAPLTAITAPIVTMSKWIVYISLAGLLLALVLSWFVSHRIYVPVERLVRSLSGSRNAEHRDEFGMFEQELVQLSQESESMRSKLNEQLPLLREGFFLQLVQGHFSSHPEGEIRERLKVHGWNTAGRRFVALLFQLTGFSNLQGRFSSGDEDLVTFAAANIIEELTQQQYEQASIINFHNFSVGLLLSFPADHPTGWPEEDMDAFCREATQTIQRILRMQVTVSISKWTNTVKHIPQLFDEARHALTFRDLFDENQIIKTEQLTGVSSLMEINYPFTLEKEIIHTIRSGLEPEAVELIGRFLQELSQGGSTEIAVQQGMLQLLASIRYSVLQSGMNPVQLFGGVNLFERLAQLKEPEQMLRWFQHKVVAVYVQELISRQDFHMKQMVEKAVLYLREHYMTMVSLDSCAEMFGTSPYTLSRAFKQIAGINFIDYLTQVRIDQSKTLLRETELKINEVAVRVGYQHTYFNRIFKKYEGITPSQYREMSRT